MRWLVLFSMLLVHPAIADDSVGAERASPPTDGPRAQIRFTKKLRKTRVWIDGQPQGEHRKRQPLPAADVSVGPHEIVISDDESAVALVCHGVVDVPAEGLDLEKLRHVCTQLDATRPSPWTTALRGSLIVIEGEDASRVTVFASGLEHLASPSTLNVAPGPVQVMLQNTVMGADEKWVCSGVIDAVAGEAHTLIVNGGGCHGFHHGAVSPTIGPTAWEAQVRARVAAEKERERQDRERGM